MFLNFLKKHKYTIILVLVVLVVVGYGAAKWYEGRMFFVNNGMASPKFPFRQYSILELARNGSVTDYVPELEEAWKALPTKTTPRETFDMYIQALRDGDIERALSYVEKEDYMEYKEDDPWHLVHFRISERDRKYLNNIKEEENLEDMIKDLEGIRTKIAPEMNKIKKGATGERVIRYQYQCRVWGGKVDTCYFGFAKNLWGDWDIVATFLMGSPVL